MSIGPCCLKGFEWNGAPAGRIGKLGSNDVYISGDNASAAVIVIHDLLGWTFANTRLLADHYAREANVTVYVPDFFGGEVLPHDLILAGRWAELDVRGFLERNAREVREPEILSCARELRAQYAKVGAVGFCYGGWAVFRLGAKEHAAAALVDCITAGHPSLLTAKDIDEVAVPTQVLASEIDPVYTAELKTHTFLKLQELGVPFDYQHFPGVEHGCFSRGDETTPGERSAMERGKNATVAWLLQYLRNP
ncbi:dienelactone hydrolase family protein [Auricularia subglabra TFB-10046 SS5]|nr:dienelactone hydrolase family protein [Auricularia subglabra TFB-10046 SS5]